MLSLMFIVTTAIPSEAVTRMCSFAEGQMFHRVVVLVHKQNAPRSERKITISPREYYYQSIPSSPDRIWKLRYVGLRNTSVEWSPGQLPVTYYGYNDRRSWTAYFEAKYTWGQLFWTQYNCTVTY